MYIIDVITFVTVSKATPLRFNLPVSVHDIFKITFMIFYYVCYHCNVDPEESDRPNCELLFVPSQLHVHFFFCSAVRMKPLAMDQGMSIFTLYM